MIVRIFSTNRIYILTFLPLVLMVLAIGAYFDAGLPSFEGQLSIFKGPIAYFNSHRILAFVCATALIVTQAFYLTRICDQLRLFDQSSHLPAFVLTISYALFGDLIVLSPVHFAILFLVMALERLLQIYNQTNVKGLLFRAGFYIGLATMFFKPSAIFILILFYHLNVFRTFNWREHLIPVLAWTTPVFYVFAAFFITGSTGKFVQWAFNRSQFYGNRDFTMFDWPGPLIFLFILIGALFHLFSSGSKRTIRINNLYKVITAGFLVCAIFLLTYPPDFLSVFALSLPFLSILLSHYLLSLRKNWWREFLIYLFLGSVMLRVFS
ncbi:MAG: DUF6427 family protein [Vicingaceae bacterium]